MNHKNINKLVDKAILIEAEEAQEAGALGYMARILVQATLPHSDPKSATFKRTNGNLSLAIIGHPDLGLPYGTYPRLILSWLTTEAVRTKNPEIILGGNLSEFMSELALIPTGGRWGTIRRLRKQMRRLFSASISCTYDKDNLEAGLGFNIATKYQLWWNPKNPEQSDLWLSTVTLGTDFFNQIVDRPIPIDMRALKALKESSMALDLYCWLTYRFSYLKYKTEIPWALLQKQFGSNYADTKQGRYKFRQKLIIQLKKVIIIYADSIAASIGKYGLILSPSRPHIRKVAKSL